VGVGLFDLSAPQLIISHILSIQKVLQFIHPIHQPGLGGSKYSNPRGYRLLWICLYEGINLSNTSHASTFYDYLSLLFAFDHATEAPTQFLP
jgi:hypothetical protein